MRFMNEWDIERATTSDHPVILKAALTLRNLAEWADSHSDGWAYWPKPARSAAKLMELIEADGTWQGQQNNDPTMADLKRALAPVKSFRTRMGADFVIVE